MKRIASAGVLDSGGGMNPFTSTIIRNVIEVGNLEKNIADLNRVYEKRVKTLDEVLRKHLPQAEFATPHGGYFFWVKIPNVDTTELRKKAKENLTDIRQGALFSSQNGLKEYMRLCISYYAEDKLEEGVLRLKKCFD
jgi:DNA-binding transcriptional MocR family regulator